MWLPTVLWSIWPIIDRLIHASQGMLRDGISEDYARLRMAAQPADEYYTAHCSHILENCQESPAEFEAVAEKFFKNLVREVFTYE